MSSSLLLSFLIALLLAAAVCTHGQVLPPPVTDTDGNIVRVNERYIIQPVNTGINGGGLIPVAAILPSCPLGITEAFPGESGVLVRIAFPPWLIPPILPLTIVRTNTDMTIEFQSNICNRISKFWEVDEFAQNPNQPEILIGGNQRRRNSWFRIERAGKEAQTNIYKFTTSAGTVGTISGALDSPQLVLTNDVDKTIFVKFIRDVSTVVTSTSRVEK
ncbi:Kunitz family trypsin and protease inhibitor protein [Raphanus sativus]|nr:kunitz trypsin inhibitor 2 [Raphanus sativus]KAJ4874930.1 Kunitz family trypsin and protease inhibitor protein [Raphanus sativus]